MEHGRVSKPGAKRQSVIALTPATELVFNVPNAVKADQTAQVSAKLTISNPTPETLCFKVKTTAPKNYCVRPNSGTLESKSSVNINVMLQPPFPSGGLSKDKFLVQTVYKKDVDDPNSPDLWKTVSKTLIMEDKLKCKWIIESSLKTDGGGGAAPSVTPTVPEVAKPTPTPVVDAAPEPKAAPKKEEPVKVAPPTRKVAPPPTQQVAKQTSNPEQVPSIILLLAVFLLGYIFGKFVL